MWILTNIGFFSIVEKPDDITPEVVTIRSRVRSDLEALKMLYLPGMLPIKESLDSDYRFRARVSKESLAAAMSKMIQGISYRNFKDEIFDVQGLQRAEHYSKVWRTLYQMQLELPLFEVNPYEVVNRISVPFVSNHCAVVIDDYSRVLMRTENLDDYKTAFLHLQTRTVGHVQHDLLSHLYQLTGHSAKTATKCVMPVHEGFEDWGYYVIQVDDVSAMDEHDSDAFKWVPSEDAQALIDNVQDDGVRDRDLELLREAVITKLYALE